ncbi:hypothetical protein SAMN05421677_10541 [Halobacillus aidingensis]|uniref:Uncharacterized protein n=1 Tax=Halobacillus aidingensis TaxID=240303 RepID=A0A1H0JJE2_HALAD|nr:hypothetical protein SAMN05421677_10541 [Halobacillus aidingensis]
MVHILELTNYFKFSYNTCKHKQGVISSGSSPRSQTAWPYQVPIISHNLHYGRRILICIHDYEEFQLYAGFFNHSGCY